ncbi:MAG: helix-turn-helix domain-containing protein [Deltaproteobacteria bacterium]|nr:helix-turn-helix domain-containing protein [Deltaproteobacteria bacterium]
MKYVNDVEAAKIAGLSPQTLRNWRQLGRGPNYIKLGRSVRYSSTDLISCLEANEDGDARLYIELNRGKKVFVHSAGTWFIYNQHYWQ